MIVLNCLTPYKFQFTVMPVKRTGRPTQRDRGTGHACRCACASKRISVWHVSELPFPAASHFSRASPFLHVVVTETCRLALGRTVWACVMRRLNHEKESERERQRQLEHSDNVHPMGASYPQRNMLLPSCGLRINGRTSLNTQREKPSC